MSAVTGREAAQQAGVTYRQFDYWCRRGWLRVPPVDGSGHPREVPWQEVRVARHMGRLVAAGVEPAIASDLARRLLEHGTVVFGDGFVLTLKEDA